MSMKKSKVTNVNELMNYREDNNLRRSKRSRTSLSRDVCAIYNYENGFRVKVGEHRFSEDPKYSQFYQKGALCLQNKRKTHKHPDGNRVKDLDAGDMNILSGPDGSETQVLFKSLCSRAPHYDQFKAMKGGHDSQIYRPFASDDDFEPPFSLTISRLGPGGFKAANKTKDFQLLIIVRSGTIQVRIHESQRTLHKNDIIWIPKWNSYALSNDNPKEEATFVCFSPHD